MAVIQKLRNSGMVVIVVIAALIIFVIGDILSPKNSSGNNSGDGDVIANFLDKDYKEKDLEPIVDKLYQQKLASDSKLGAKMQQDEKFRIATVKEIYQSAWEQLVKQEIIMKEIDKSGIALSDADVNELLFGKHPSESMMQIPDFQTDNAYDVEKVKMIFKQGKTNSMLKAQLMSLVESVKSYERLSRYATYIAKSSSKTKTEKEYEYIVSNQSVEGSIVYLAHSSIPDKDVKPTDEDLKNYLDKHKEKYKYTNEMRTLKYVLWDVIPTAEDSAYSKEQAIRLAEGLRMQSSPDTIGALGFFNKSTLPEDAPSAVSNLLWFASINEVVGPVYDNGKYHIFQKVEEANDSVPVVKVSHILIPLSGPLPDGTIVVDSVMAEQIARDLQFKVVSGAEISMFASKLSGDQGTASKGGDLGWGLASNYVPQFAAFCSTAQKGQVGMVKTQFGFHVIKMMEEPEFKKIKYTQSSVEVSASTKTVGVIDKKSRNFKNSIKAQVGSFEKAIEKMAMIPRIMKDLKTDVKMIAGIEEAADVKTIMYWLFGQKRVKGEVSDVFAFATKHVIIQVDEIKHVGYATIDDSRSIIEPLVREELKGKKIGDKLQKFSTTAKSPKELATKSGTLLIPIEGLKMSQNFIPQLASEMGILGSLFGVQPKKFSVPVIGSGYTGVMWITKREPVIVPKSVANSPDMMEAYSGAQYIIQPIQDAINKKAGIQDYRYKFEWF
ncbi:MAG: hypothetical protein EXR17_01720 [Flavobacteriaceae bacterium]|nr:hypothetical protein [Flavobacteriaceae bacterium]